MSLSEEFKKIKGDIITIAVILLVGLISFGLGRLSAISEKKTPITVENLTGATVMGAAVMDRPEQAEKLYVASKNGTKYHYPWCSGAQRILEENTIWFPTKEEAEAAGYTPAANCKGL